MRRQKVLFCFFKLPRSPSSRSYLSQMHRESSFSPSLFYTLFSSLLRKESLVRSVVLRNEELREEEEYQQHAGFVFFSCVGGRFNLLHARLLSLSFSVFSRLRPAPLACLEKSFLLASSKFFPTPSILPSFFFFARALFDIYNKQYQSQSAL